MASTEAISEEDGSTEEQNMLSQFDNQVKNKLEMLQKNRVAFTYSQPTRDQAFSPLFISPISNTGMKWSVDLEMSITLTLMNWQPQRPRRKCLWLYPFKSVSTFSADWILQASAIFLLQFSLRVAVKCFTGYGLCLETVCSCTKGEVCSLVPLVLKAATLLYSK